MSKANNKASAEPMLAEAELASYLQQHPDFLARHPDVLAALEAHHDSGAAVSLIERQVAQLRTRNVELQARLDELVGVAHANEQHVTQLNGVARALVAASGIDELVTALTDSMQREMPVDAVFIGMRDDDTGLGRAGDQIHVLTDGSPEDGAVAPVYRRGKPVCGPLSAAQIEALFADAQQSSVASAALVPLGRNGVHGALVLASAQAETFTADMGTLFLELLGELVTTALRRHLGAHCLS